MATRILIADDHLLVSQGLQAMLSLSDDLELVEAVADGATAVEKVKQEGIDIVLMDVSLGNGINGIEATRQIKEHSPETRVVIITMFTDPGTVAEAVKAGADAYVSKSSTREFVLQTLYEVVNGRSVLDPNVTDGIFGRISNRDPNVLSDRELEVLQELTHGHSTKGVAERIHVSEETVKSYLKQVFRKLDVKDRTEAVAEGFRRGLVH
ncbi:response regulator transcription factor [soil metagenome]|jgi:DNA-binding NarL/FixJ family response regulator|nr:response regulator transcription factor [Actinomycetota bacterium]MBA3753268.1 response regulator transcription factor [Nitrospira sp.]MDQ3218598.1 response regulator transcription factor [Actinomycetota bacterium]